MPAMFKPATWMMLMMLGSGLLPAAEPHKLVSPLVQPSSVRKLVADGRHNAFTSLVKWRNVFFLSYRSGLAHNSADADCVVMQSPDSENWKQAMRIDIAPDDRGGHFLATPKRLFLYLGAMKGAALQSYVLHTDDGNQWTKPAPVLEPQWIFWKPFEHNGRLYANAHLKAEGKDAAKKRESKLIASVDGLQWETISTVRKGNYESETTFFFGPNEHLFAFLRQKYSGPGFIMESDPPYQQWTQRNAGVHFSGHCIRTFRGVNYLVSRTLKPKKEYGAMIYTFADGKLTPHCELPAGGDCSYAEPVEVGDEMLVSYYSTHEGTTNIYLARVPLRKP
jgi:hypothetical protein